MATKRERYAALVGERKACRRCAPELTNPSVIADGRFDSDEIGPWTRWQANLDAEIMAVAQDWGTVGHFESHRGWDTARDNPTNRAVHDLLKLVVDDVPAAALSPEPQVVFLTNAALCLKQSVVGFQGDPDRRWFDNCRYFLKEQIEIVRPKLIIAVGQWAFDSILRAYGLRPPNVFRVAVDDPAGVPLPNGVLVFGVYHCGSRGTNRNRLREAQVSDWLRIRAALERIRAAT